MRKSREVPKLQYFIQDVFDSEEFRQNVEDLRNNINIPTDVSLEFTEEDSIQVNTNPHDYFPFLLKNRSDAEQEKIKINVNQYVDDELSELPIPWTMLRVTLKLFIFHNMYAWESIPAIADSLEKTKLITLTNEKDTFFDSTKRRIDDFSQNDSNLEREYIDTVQRRLRDYPVVLWISPIAGKNEMLSFIDENWSSIQKMQLQFLKQSSRKERFVFMKNLRQRDPLVQKKTRAIMEMKNKMPLSKIASFVNSNFPQGRLMDSGVVGKIISKKKRIPSRLKRTPPKT